jgi:hypothetical protein
MQRCTLIEFETAIVSQAQEGCNSRADRVHDVMFGCPTTRDSTLVEEMPCDAVLSARLPAATVAAANGWQGADRGDYGIVAD